MERTIRISEGAYKRAVKIASKMEPKQTIKQVIEIAVNRLEKQIAEAGGTL